MGNAARDDNRVPSLIGSSNVADRTPVDIYADPTTHRLLVNATITGGAGDGSILDGVDTNIKATVFDYANSNPLGVVLRDTAGDYVSVGGGTQYTEDAVAAANPTGTAVNLVRQDTPAALVTLDGDNVTQRGTNYGAAYAQIVTSAGAFVDTFGGGTQYADAAARGTATGTLAMVDDGTNIQSLSGDSTGKLNVNNISGTVSLPTGAATSAKQDTGNTSLASIDGKITAVNTGAVVVSSSALPAGASTLAEQQSQTTALQLIDDAVYASDATISKVVGIGGQFDDTAPGTTTENSVRPVRMSTRRELYNQIRDAAGNERGANVTAGNALVVDGSASTQPISAASLPLPTGAATLAGQTQPGVDIGDVTVNNAAGAAAVNIQDGGNSITVDGAVTTSGTVTEANSAAILTSTQLIDDTIKTLGTDTYLEATTKGNLIAVVRRDANTSLVDTTNEVAPLQVNATGELKVAQIQALPTGANVIGALTANQSVNVAQVNGVTPLMGNGVTGTGSNRVTLASDGTAISTVGYMSVKVDQTTVGTTNAISLAQIGANTVASGNGVSSTGVLRVAQVSDGTGVLATVSTVTNLSQLAGAAIAMNTGVRSAGTQRVTIATDDIVPASQSGTWTVQPGNTANSTPWLTTQTPKTTGGLTTFHLVSAATTNATNIKASAGQVFGWFIYNSNASARKLVFHNTAGTPTAGAAVFFSIVIPPTSGANVEYTNGIAFSTGIAITTVTGLADADSAAVALNDLIINVFYA